MNNYAPKVSVLMLTHGAPEYVKISILTQKKRTVFEPGYELIVVDNDSDQKTRRLLSRLYFRGYIDKLVFAGENLMFARGNNVAASLCSAESEYVLLLNSDVEIRRADWMQAMVAQIERPDEKVAAIGLRSCEGIPRCDGFAMLVRKELYLRHKLDESFEWWWSVTKLQARMRSEGWKVIAVCDYEPLLYHFGDKSPQDAIATAKGMDVEDAEIQGWFQCEPSSFEEIQTL